MQLSDFLTFPPNPLFLIAVLCCISYHPSRNECFNFEVFPPAVPKFARTFTQGHHGSSREYHLRTTSRTVDAGRVRKYIYIKKYHILGFKSYVIDFSLHVLSNRGVTELLWVMGTSTHRNESTRRLPGCLSIKPTDRYHVFLHSGSQTVPGRSSVFVLGQKANAMRPRPPRPF